MIYRLAIGVLAVTLGASAAVVTYSSLPTFISAAGSAQIAVNFDGIAPNTNITGQTFGNATLQGPGAPLLVVNAADTFTQASDFASGIVDASTNVLPVTSGSNVLSPGGTHLVAGPDPNQNDDLTILFGTSVPAFGIDILYQSYDSAPFTSISVYDQNDALVFAGQPAVPGAGGAGSPGGFTFWGVTGTAGTTISRIVIDESDENDVNPDSNIGFDTFRFGPTQVPEPSTLLLVAAGMGILLWTKIFRS